ncbi:effector-associated domain 2-containing protein [Dactylosporangium sp. CA-092794]|uniref:effector-associated domain 2-containing protein n=1 Tax=Dactylosporangium sp. CA-092794 TaxID=3239929 RepID=UPI003D93D0D0
MSRRPSNRVLQIAAGVSVVLIGTAIVIFLSRQTLPRATQFAGLGSFVVGILSLSVSTASLVTARRKAAAERAAQPPQVAASTPAPRTRKAARPAQPAPPTPALAPDDRERITAALLAVPRITNPDTWDTVIQQLPDDLAALVSRSGGTRQQILALLPVLEDHPGGYPALIRALRTVFGPRSHAVQDFERLAAELALV